MFLTFTTYGDDKALLINTDYIVMVKPETSGSTLTMNDGSSAGTVLHIKEEFAFVSENLIAVDRSKIKRVA